MKKQIAGILILLSLGAFSWAQGSKDLFDAKKSQEELEIMKGILNTTISFIGEKDTENRISAWGNPDIDAFYLADQGAVFVIPISSHPFVNVEISRSLDATREYLNALKLNIRREGNSILIPAPAAPPAPSAAPALPEPPNPPESPFLSQQDREELKKRIEEFREKMEQSREEALKRREKLMQSLAEVKTSLIEALANYGDSLTTVKPDEHVNLVLTTESSEDRQKERFDVISARRSWISDYKAGRLSLDAFKQKVLQYTE